MSKPLEGEVLPQHGAEAARKMPHVSCSVKEKEWLEGKGSRSSRKRKEKGTK